MALSTFIITKIILKGHLTVKNVAAANTVYNTAQFIMNNAFFIINYIKTRYLHNADIK